MRTANAAMESSRVRIGHLAVSCDAPGPDRVVVVKIIVAANREKFGQCRLDVTGFICGAALNYDGFAVPLPGQPEAGERPGQHRFLQLRFLPALAVIDRDIDTPDLAVTAPGDAADLVKSGRAQPLATRAPRDDGFALHVKRELACRSGRHQVSVLRGFSARIGRLCG